MVIPFKAFFNAMQDAVQHAGERMMEHNLALVEQYFFEEIEAGSGQAPTPKSVLIAYPGLNTDGNSEKQPLTVPLISLTPLSMLQFQAMVINARFEMELINNEVHLHFPEDVNSARLIHTPNTTTGSIVLTFDPQQNPEERARLIDGYDAILRSQFVLK